MRHSSKPNAHNMPHRAAIHNGLAACTCGKWPGTWKQTSETEGQFTVRAFAEHTDHINAANALMYEQTSMFAHQESLGL